MSERVAVEQEMERGRAKARAIVAEQEGAKDAEEEEAPWPG